MSVDALGSPQFAGVGLDRRAPSLNRWNQASAVFPRRRLPQGASAAPRGPGPGLAARRPRRIVFSIGTRLYGMRVNSVEDRPLPVLPTRRLRTCRAGRAYLFRRPRLPMGHIRSACRSIIAVVRSRHSHRDWRRTIRARLRSSSACDATKSDVCTNVTDPLPKRDTSAAF